MIQTLERFLQGEWKNFMPREPTPRQIRIAVLSSSRDPGGNRVMLAFGDRSSTPAVLVKTPRRPSRASLLEREWRLLQLLIKGLPLGMKQTVPEPLCMSTVRMMPVFVQSALPGQNLKTLIQRGSHGLTAQQLERDLARMERWLADLQKAWPPYESPRGLEIERHPGMVASMEEALPVLLEASILNQAQAKHVRERATVIDRAAAGQKTCWVHGDLWPGNVLLSSRYWGVIDWDALSIGHAWEDRLWYALHLGMVYFGRLSEQIDLRESLKRTFFEEHPFTRSIRSYLDETQQEIGPSDVSHRDYLLMLLAREASRKVAGKSRGRVFDLIAAEVLHDWLSGVREVRI